MHGRMTMHFCLEFLCLLSCLGLLKAARYTLDLYYNTTGKRLEFLCLLSCLGLLKAARYTLDLYYNTTGKRLEFLCLLSLQRK